MRFSTTSWLLSATTLLTNTVSARPSIPDPSSITKRAGITVTTGAAGSVQPRLEVRQLQKTQPDQWNLFLLGMQRWMKQDPTDGTGNGYYGIAGIHGVPTVSWGGVEENPLSKGIENETDHTSTPAAYGYCTHDSLVFPAWHRAYLALFEQTLVEQAIEVAQEYPESSRARMVDAAQKLRLPFWDWAAKPPSSGEVFPSAFTQQTVTVEGPNGPETIGNPLFQFNISNPGSDDPYGGQAFIRWDETLRYPDSENNPANSQNSIAQEFLSSAQSSNQESVFNLLSNCPSWQSFSNYGGGSNQCGMSIEGIHDNIHSLVGGIPQSKDDTGGHMAYLPVAAFDPAFWVHHANVDRIFALWQAVYGDEYAQGSQAIGYPTWTVAPGELQNASSPLTPFFRTAHEGDYHNMNTVKDWTTFNYDYPEFMAIKGTNQTIETVIAAYYGPSASLTAGGIPVPTSPSNSNSSETTSPKSNSTVTSSAIGRNSTYSATGLPSHTKATSGLSFPTLSIPSGGLNPTKLIPTGLLPTGIIPTGISSLPTSIPELLNCTKNAGTTQNQYVANIVADNNALDSSYKVYVFNGAPQCSSQTYGLAKNLIGSVTMWSHQHSGNTNKKNYGAVPLTFTLQKLVNAGKISDMSPNTILPWLHQNLEWRIVSASGEVSPDQVKGFSLSIYSAQSEIQTNGGLPKWSPVQPQLGATKGKKGGADKIPDFVASISSGLLGQNGSKGPATATTTMVVTQTHTICPCKTAASY